MRSHAVDAHPLVVSERGRRVAALALHLTAVTVVAVGLLAQVLRPLAPDLGPPPAPSLYFDRAFLELADAYRTPLYRASLAALALRLTVAAAVALSGPGRRITRRIVDRVGPDRPARAAACVALAVVVATDVLLFPIVFWAGWVHEGAYGFRTQGLAGWAYDWALARLSGWVPVGVLVLVGYWLMARLPSLWPPAVGLLAGAATAAVVFASPAVLEPLRFNTRPLAPGPLRELTEGVVERSGRPLERILVADASRRTTRQNAYISGLGSTRRVVLYDTLIHGRPPAEVTVVVAHELGHDLHHDLPRAVAFAAAGSLLLAYTLAWMVRWRVRRGLQAGQADPRAAAVLLAAALALSAVTMPVQNLVSRRAEAAADLAALNLAADPDTYVSQKVGMARANLAKPVPPRWVYLLWSTHPAPAARIQMGERWPFEAESDSLPPAPPAGEVGR